MKLLVGVILGVGIMLCWGIQAHAQCCGGCSGGKIKSASVSSKAQTVCPVMGGAIDKKQYVDVNGYRIYVCCPECKKKVKDNPDKYIAKIKAAGEALQKTPVALCSKCGQIKGTDKCCKADAAKCSKCGLDKGAPGCCKMPKTD